MYSTIINGESTTLGTSGLLYRSNKVMYDRATRTLWNQLTGKPVIGPLAGTDAKLDIFPVAFTTWGEWLAEHPETTVISLDTGYYSARVYKREESKGSFYYGYRAEADTMFPIWNRDDRLEVKANVVGVTVDKSHKAYPIDSLNYDRVINDTLGGRQFVIVGSPQTSSARVYSTNGQQFSLIQGDDSEGLPTLLIDSDGIVWSVTELELISSANPEERLPLYPSQVSFWFGWFTFHPDTLLYNME